MVHIPVLTREVLNYLGCAGNRNYIDATVGAGGHSKLILENTAPEGIVVGFEWDPVARQVALENLEGFNKRFRLIEDNFREVEKAGSFAGQIKFSGILYDLGLSSIQLDDGKRGFSILRDGPLDMRMDINREISAEIVVNDFEEEKLASILKDFGEERFAKAIARRVVRERLKGRISSTRELAEIVEASIPQRFRPRKIHSATKSFMALRIFVNEEFENLEGSLAGCMNVLSRGARIVVISFHSMEDRIVKTFFREQASACTCPTGLPGCVCGKKPALKIITRKPLISDEDEIHSNPRARSAKLRVAEVL